ncbi:hypothetical protein T265_01690 [Opisthorchis viverrini]|uniref:Amiloride-sensitive sodium channel n=1 Tax=Opisthorchis viverrini TaxID=6198 RepID=A0A074ZXV4_OPIVI|nr:hypothetical protein T265_01690 [Opisthorchis viverrini]KER32263.1 hypothetical protein T265_01690 [Opisthorchis viverrini]
MPPGVEEPKTNGTKPRRTRRKVLQKISENISLFLESISIRGCNRIVRAQSMFIRLLWICFLICTTVFLIVSVRRIVKEYLLYSVNIETEERMDAPTEFPSVTFCNHQPFSEKAYELWRSGSVISPTQFNRILRQKAEELVDNNSGNISEHLLQMVAHYSIVFDTIKMYYQNLDWPDQKRLGHQRNQSIYMCLIRFSGEELLLGGPGCYDEMIHIKERSHPHHYNCYTVDINIYLSRRVQELGLIVWLGPPENYDIRYRQAFLQDVFEQAHGLRVAIHEPGQLVNLDRLGIQIEPGRMNEINFEVIRKEHQQTPRKPCIQDPKDQYRDLDGEYDYEFELCLDSLIQQIVIERCSCVYAYLPRIVIPNATLPYCGRLLRNNQLDAQGLFDRKECVRHVVQQFAKLRKQFEAEGKCLRRCQTLEYDKRVSVTTWRATQWQLYWSQETANALEEIMASSPNFTKASVDRLTVYLKTANLSTAFNAPDVTHKGITRKYGFSDRHTYLLIKRKRNDTVVRKETLVLTLDALVSRIGGLCSLYIGMTFAIFIEVIEFFYMVYMKNSKSKKRKRANCTDEATTCKRSHSNGETVSGMNCDDRETDLINKGGAELGKTENLSNVEIGSRKDDSSPQ